MKQLTVSYSDNVLYYDIPKGGAVVDVGGALEVRNKKGDVVAAFHQPRAWDIEKVKP